MKKFHLLTLLFLLVAFGAAKAQTYSSTHYASVGDTVYLTKAQTSLLDFDTTGSSFIWDYSSLTGVSQERLVFRNPNQTGFSALQWPYIFNANNTNLSSTTGQSRTVSALGITLSNPNDYDKKSSSELKQVASSYQLSYNSLSLSIKNQFSAPDVLHKFPIAFGNSDSSTSGYTTNIPGTYYEKQIQKRKNEVDGSGSVTTPFGTFANALRITSTVQLYDSIVVLGTSLPVIQRTYRELKWLDASSKYPVLTVVQNKVENAWITSSVEYLDEEHFYPVTALFAYTPLSPVQGDTVAFQNLSSNATQYHWNFGDAESGSNTSTQAHPSHIFTQPGTYSIQLIAANEQFSDTATLPIVVYSNVVPTASFTYVAASGDSCTKIVFTNTSTNALSYIWNFGDTTSLLNSSVATSPSHRFSAMGTFPVRLIASNGTLKDTLLMDIVVQGTVVPQLTISTPTTTIVSGTSVTFTATAINGGTSPTYQWKKNNADAGTNQNTYTDAGLQNGDVVLCLLTSNAACLATASATSNSLTMSVTPDMPTSLAKPVITPTTGTYPDPMMVTISCATPGVQIYYTTSGNVPAVGTGYTKLYSAPFSQIASGTVRAIAILSGVPNSEVAVSYITITNPGIVDAPIITPGTGSYSGQQMVSISCATAGSSIYYTLNGNTPNTTSANSYTKLYSGPVAINSTTTIKALGVKSGLENSKVTVQILTITSPTSTVATPVITPGSGTFIGTQVVSISCATAGVTIYYTTSGNVPVVETAYTKVYSGSFTISATTTIRAMATLSGSINSAVAVSYLTLGPGRLAVDLEEELTESPTYSVFPNPSTGVFNLKWGGTERPEVVLLDEQGRKMNTTILQNDLSTATLDLSAALPGFYVLQIRQNGKLQTRKLIRR